MHEFTFPSLSSLRLFNIAALHTFTILYLRSSLDLRPWLNWLDESCVCGPVGSCTSIRGTCLRPGANSSDQLRNDTIWYIIHYLYIYHYDTLWSWYTMLRDDTRSSFGKQRQQSMVKVGKFSLETLERWRAPARSFQRIEAPAVHQIRRACWEWTSEEVRRNSAYLGKGQRLSISDRICLFLKCTYPDFLDEALIIRSEST